MKTLTDEQAHAIRSFMEAFDLTTTGVWTGIEECMRESFGIEDPEAALEDAKSALE